jgi:hypothetical protein
VKEWSKLKKAAVISTIAVFGIGGVSALAGPPEKPKTSPPTPPPSSVKSNQIETKTETSTEAIPFQSTTQNDSSLASGKTEVAVAGVNGVKTINYKVTYANGKETNREKVSEEVTTPPVNQVTKVGTYVYVAPVPAPAPVSGPTALCRDGTYSYSANHQGTCSHHGGVSVWYR